MNQDPPQIHMACICLLWLLSFFTSREFPSFFYSFSCICWQNWVVCPAARPTFGSRLTASLLCHLTCSSIHYGSYKLLHGSRDLIRCRFKFLARRARRWCHVVCRVSRWDSYVLSLGCWEDQWIWALRAPGPFHSWALPSACSRPLLLGHDLRLSLWAQDSCSC